MLTELTQKHRGRVFSYSRLIEHMNERMELPV